MKKILASIKSFIFNPRTEMQTKSALALIAIATLAGYVGSLASGAVGIYLGVGMTIATTALTVWFSREIVMYLFKAKEVQPNDRPEGFDLHAMVNHLRALPAVNITTAPKICIIQSDKLNAFATGRSKHHAAIAITTGLLKKAREKANGDMALATRWIEAVWCHELGHLAHNDIAVNAVGAIFVSITRLIASKIYESRWYDREINDRINERQGNRQPKENTWTVVALEFMFFKVAIPTVTTLLQLMLSRSREYAADDMAAECGKAADLADAFRQLLSDDMPDSSDADDEAKMGAFSNLTCMSLHPKHDNDINDKLKDKEQNWLIWGFVKAQELFSTHPAMNARIERLDGHVAEERAALRARAPV